MTTFRETLKKYPPAPSLLPGEVVVKVIIPVRGLAMLYVKGQPGIAGRMKLDAETQRRLKGEEEGFFAGSCFNGKWTLRRRVPDQRW